jgi:Tfp pilus assembly protein PilX
VKATQTGASLIIVVILLVIVMISAIALVRSSETVGAVAGNVAFKQAATAAADTGIANAEQWLAALASPDTAVSGVYYATGQTVDSYGLPAIDWGGVPAATVTNYNVQYVIERLCQGSLPVADVTVHDRRQPEGRQPQARRAVLHRPAIRLLPYRVTVRVQGPRNAESFVQALLAK